VPGSCFNAARPAVRPGLTAAPQAFRLSAPLAASGSRLLLTDAEMAYFQLIRHFTVICYRAAMGIALSEAALRLLDGRNYAVLATVNPDGSPQTSVMWVGRDGGDLLFSTVEGRVKHRNMLRDPRVSVTVIDSSDPENYVELRGRVSMTPDTGRRLDTRLSWKYDGKDPDEDRPGAVRVAVRMVVEKAAGYAA
jgi:PPOX class probable F420-dependent enzyme